MRRVSGGWQFEWWNKSYMSTHTSALVSPTRPDRQVTQATDGPLLTVIGPPSSVGPLTPTGFNTTRTAGFRGQHLVWFRLYKKKKKKKKTEPNQF